MKKGQAWTKDQIEYLYNHYSSERAEDIGEAIGKSKIAVQKKAFVLKIGKDKEGFREIRSLACSGIHSGNFKGYRRKTKKGYYVLYKPDHPSATSRGMVMEHRLVMEEHLGIIIPKGFVVHHINGKKDDNRIENLALMTESAHTILHNNREYTKGEKHPLYKKIDVEEIKKLKDEGQTCTEICKKLGIDKTKYYSVLKGA